MSKPFPLQIVLELVQSRTDTAARELGQRLASERNAKAQLRMLEDYRQEYAERFRNAAQGGLSPQQWQNYQDFMSRLDTAIGQQATAVAGSERHTAAGQKLWLEEKKRLRAFDALADRHHDRERLLAERRDQKATDEIAARRHAAEPTTD